LLVFDSSKLNYEHKLESYTRKDSDKKGLSLDSPHYDPTTDNQDKTL